MTKYHINLKTGNPGRCTAAAGKCPFGGNENHFSSEQEARSAYEARNSSQTVNTPVRKVGVRLEKRAAKYQTPKTWDELPSQPNDEQLKNAAAYAMVNNSYAPVAYKFTQNTEGFKNLSEYDGADWLTVAQKDYIIATPEGNYIKIGFQGGVNAQFDGSWEYWAEYDGAYEYYNNLEDLKANKPNKTKSYGQINIPTDTVFRSKTRGWDELAYNQYSSQDARAKALEAVQQLSKPYELARIAHLESYEGKISKNQLLGKNNFGHENEKIRAAAVARKEFPVEAHEKALNDPSVQVRISLAGRPDLSKEHMEKILTMNDTDAENYSLGYHENPRHALLTNPKLPLRIMSKLAREGTLREMSILDKNPGLSEKAREILRARAKQLGMRNLVR